MKLGYTIIYVPNVAESLSFFESAFGLSRRFLHESGDYGELEMDRPEFRRHSVAALRVALFELYR